MANLSRTLIKEKHVFNSFWLITLDLVKNNYIFVLLYFDLHHKVYFPLTSFLIPYILKYECNLQNRVNVLTKHIAEVHDTFVWNHVCLFFFNIPSCKINNEVTVTYFLCWDTRSLQDVSINQVWYIVDTLWGSKYDPDRKWISFWSYKRIFVRVWDDSGRLLCSRQIFLEELHV